MYKLLVFLFIIGWINILIYVDDKLVLLLMIERLSHIVNSKNFGCCRWFSSFVAIDSPVLLMSDKLQKYSIVNLRQNITYGEKEVNDKLLAIIHVHNIIDFFI